MSKEKIPSIIEDINKSRGRNVIATLDDALSFRLKRFFSGSFFINDITGGGYGYRRIQLLFGAKSAGKNASLNQMIAYNQRICKKCLLEKGVEHIRPDFYDIADKDRWTYVLRYYMQMPRCTCEEDFVPKKFLILDYERSLSLESPRIITVKLIKTKDTNAIIDELDYNDKLVHLESLHLKEKISAKEKNEIEEVEKWIENLDITETKVEELGTKDYLRQCGILTNELLVADPADTEDGIEICRDTIKGNGVDAIIWDSLQAAVPKYVKGREAEQATMGVEAKQNGLLMRLVCSAFAAEDIKDEKEAFKPALFVTSQVRASLGGFVAGPATYSGGHAVEHHISVALEIKRQQYLDDSGKELGFGKEYFGQKVRIRPDKNKLNAPGGMYEFNYYFRQGQNFPVGYIDHVYELIELGVKYNVIERAGAYYRFRGKNVQGIQNFAELFRTDPDVVGKIYSSIREKM